jgi:hypothetical protein
VAEAERHQCVSNVAFALEPPRAPQLVMRTDMQKPSEHRTKLEGYQDASPSTVGASQNQLTQRRAGIVYSVNRAAGSASYTWAGAARLARFLSTSPSFFFAETEPWKDAMCAVLMTSQPRRKVLLR